MKALLILLLVPFSAWASTCPPNSNNPDCYPDTDYPGQTPDWTQRYTVGCTLTNNETGALHASMSHGYLDYAQSGSMFVYLNNAVRDWYTDLKDAAQNQGYDTRLIPDMEDPLGAWSRAIADIERKLAE